MEAGGPLPLHLHPQPFETSVRVDGERHQVPAHPAHWKLPRAPAGGRWTEYNGLMSVDNGLMATDKRLLSADKWLMSTDKRLMSWTNGRCPRTNG